MQITKMMDLTKIETGVKLPRAELMAAAMRHLAAMNDSQLAQKRADNNRRGIGLRVAIGSAHVPAAVARAFAYIKVA